MAYTSVQPDNTQSLPAGSGIHALLVLFLVCLFIQAFMDTHIETLAFCVVATAVTFYPIYRYGRNIYTILCMIFGLRYTGVALVAKTIYGQSLDEHLVDSTSAYALSSLILVFYVAAIMLANRLDSGRGLSFFGELSQKQLRVMSLTCLLFGFAANVVLLAAGAANEGGPGGGATFVIANALTYIFPAGLIAETIYVSRSTQGRTFISPVLAIASLAIFLLTTAANAREFTVTCLIGIFVAAYLCGSFAWRHALAASVIVCIFLFFISPVFLYVRSFRDTLDREQMLSLTLQTMADALTDPDFYDRVYLIQETSSINRHGVTSEYDYYGNNSNVLNRLSYVALVDHMYSYTTNSEPVGEREVEQVLERIAPSFLYKKTTFSYSVGDFLGWEIGAESTRGSSYINFSLPMEGLAVWGWAGAIAYPFILIFLTLKLMSSICSLRHISVMGLSLLIGVQHELVEGTSDIIITLMTRVIVIFAITMTIIFIAIRSTIKEYKQVISN